MESREDFSPIAEVGSIEKASGILGRKRRRASLDPVGHQFVRVIVDGKTVVASGDQLSPGERYWGSGATWVNVDMSQHDLILTIGVADQQAGAGYQIVITALVWVTDAVIAVKRNARSIQRVVHPPLHEAIHKALAQMRNVERDTDPVRFLNRCRNATEGALRTGPAAVPSEFDLGWIAMRITSIAVAFDTETENHIKALVSSVRKGQLDVATHTNRLQETDFEIGIRTKWFEYLEPRLRNPVTRAVEIVAANPSEDNIRSVVNQLNHGDQQFRAEFLTALKMLVDNNLVADLPDIDTIRVLIDGLQASSPGERRPSLPSNPPTGAISAASHTVEDTAQQQADRSWGAP